MHVQSSRRPSASGRWSSPAACLLALVCLANPRVSRGQAFREATDPAGDAVARRTDVGSDAEVDAHRHHPPDLVAYRIGAWQADDPQVSLFVGDWAETGDWLFLRLDLDFTGLAHPPGFLNLSFEGYDPFLFGDHPVHGYVELDVDENPDTGGELAFPEFRYLTNAARWGGVPSQIAPTLKSRVASALSEIDDDCATEPRVEYSGEEFHLALFATQYASHTVISGNDDAIFDAGEVWELDGTWLHRAHGFEPYSLACGSETGVYIPPSRLRWAHEPFMDRTTVTLVFPLTNAASAAMRGEMVEPNDCDPFNQSSIEEALFDLQLSATVCALIDCGPCQDLILEWAVQIPSQYLAPKAWPLTAVLASASGSQPKSEETFVWSDLWPDVLAGDFNGSGASDAEDTALAEAWIAAQDGGDRDTDGVVDGKVTLEGFANDFSIYDLDSDGIVGAADAALKGSWGDSDGDGDVDLADWAAMVVCCMGPGASIPGSCLRADFDEDCDVDLADVARALNQFEPGGG